MKPITCIFCDTEDFDLVGINHPVTKKPLGIVYCCQACKPELTNTIKLYAKMTLRGMESYEHEWKMEAEVHAYYDQ